MVVAGVALIAAGAQAAPTLEWTVEKNAGTSDCGVALDRWTLHATAAAGQVLTAVDARPGGTNPYGGFYDCPDQYAGIIDGEEETWDFGADGVNNPNHPSDALHQVWLFNGAVETPKDPPMSGQDADELDTHWIIPATLLVDQTDEDNDMSCNSSDTGWGTYLHGLVGWAGYEGITEADLVQIVVPSGQDFYAKVQVAQGDGAVTEFAGCVPEPATMSLLGLGGIAALIRRRRRS